MDLSKLDHVPGIASVMTPFPHPVQVTTPLPKAEALMREHGIRHLPVCDGDEIVGVVTQRDLALLTNPALPKTDRVRIRVGQLCTRDPYVVDLHSPIDGVAREMAERHIGCAIVTREGKLAGIFTTTDACRVVADLFARLRGGGGEAA